MNKEQLKNILVCGGGATLKNGKIKELKSGYMVSLKMYEKVLNKDLINIDFLLKELLKNSKGFYIGLWCNNNSIYIDYSIRIKTLKKALELGKQEQQQAIYNNKKQECIFIEY